MVEYRVALPSLAVLLGPGRQGKASALGAVDSCQGLRPRPEGAVSCCYGLFWSTELEKRWLRFFVDGHPVSGRTSRFLSWCSSEELAALGKGGSWT